MVQLLNKLFLIYLLLAAKLQIAKYKPLIIGVTGSAGKTSTVNTIGQILSKFRKTKFTTKGNSESGLPLEILDIPVYNYDVLGWLKVVFLVPIKLITNWKQYNIFVAEMSIDSPDEPKNMSYLLKIVKPQIGVFLNVSSAHGENFDKLIKSEKTNYEFLVKKEIAKEKFKLILSLSSKAIAILNSDDEIIMEVLKLNSNRIDPNVKIITFGRHGDIKIANIETSLKGFKVNYIINKITYTIKLNNYVLEENFAYTFAAALAVVNALNLNIATAIKTLKTSFKLQPGRFSLFDGINDTKIIDSSYNASKDTTLSALNLLEKIGENRRKIAVLGEMREIGKASKQVHEEVLKKAIDVANYLILVGTQMKLYGENFLQTTGFENYKIFADYTKNEWPSEIAGDFLKQIIHAGDVILIKGSQNNIFLEYVVEKLLKNPIDKKNLCRQDKYWITYKKNLLNKNKHILHEKS